MQSYITVADARTRLAKFVPNSSSEFLTQLNLAVERLTNSGKWYGSMMILALPNVSEYITLPPRYLSILAGKFDSWPVLTFSNWFSYQEVGAGDLSDTTWWYGRILEEIDGVVTQVAIDESGPIEIYSNAGDNALTVRLYGTDADTNQPVIDSNGVEGEEVTLAAPFATTTHNFSTLDGVQKELSKFPVQAKVNPTDGSATYQIAEWQSWEDRPSYRRYFIGPATKTVKCLCQRRFIPMIAETDWVIPSNYGALTYALKALALESAGYEANNEAQKCWDLAYSILNQQAKATRGGSQVPIPTNVWGWGQPLPRTN